MSCLLDKGFSLKLVSFYQFRPYISIQKVKRFTFSNNQSSTLISKDSLGAVFRGEWQNKRIIFSLFVFSYKSKVEV